jgi:DNA-directed RNA polymerase specialized sigma subunit
MKIVIDIPEKAYEAFKEWHKNKVATVEQSIIANGTPLPKGHGRLKDADEIANMVNVLKNNWDRYGNEYESGRYESYDYAVDTINDAPTIIEADTAESEAEI